MDTYIGFDSAWTDNLKAPGAICALQLENLRPIRFHPPRLASFGQALPFVRDVESSDGLTLIALDQSTIVPNLTGMRSVERAAASLISWLGGGVQPSNRGRLGMFCDASPLWSFLQALNARQDPERARSAASGLFLMEVFPALALASFSTDFFGRLAAPRYNPARPGTFRLQDWRAVAAVASGAFRALEFTEPARWCDGAREIARPRKADQDRLDAMLCLLIALHWRLRPREESLMLGDLTNGYMIVPASPAVRQRLRSAARKLAVPIDGVLP